MANGAFDADEADLIGRTRIEGERLAAAALRLGLSYQACRQRRVRAEQRLCAYLGQRLTAEHSGAPDRPADDTVTAA